MSSNSHNNKEQKATSKILRIEGVLLAILGIFLLLLLIGCFLSGIFNVKSCNCNSDSDINPQPVPHTGDVQILLSWSNYNDLDIACIDPFGQKVWYQNKTVPSGGQLDIDMNAGGPSRRDPIENIYWPTGGAPKGEYKVILTYYARYDNRHLATPYTVKVKHGSETHTYTGTLTIVNQEVTICTFTLD